MDPGTSSSSSSAPVRPGNPRVPTSQDDVSLSSLRSRRLLSGYLFGSPQVDPATPTREPAAAVSPSAARQADLAPLDDVPHPPPTQSTVISGQEEEIIEEAAADDGRMSPSTEEENITLAGATDDALDGFLDGEADADDRATAVQAEHGGSQGYMRNEPGAAGEYRFPTHRLKRKMKGAFDKAVSRIGR